MKPSVHPPLFIRTIFHNLIWKIPTQEKKLYLTFDDGPIPELTPWILNELNKFNAKATFFCVGENVQKYNGIYREILKNGQQTGNHTYNHLDGWKNKSIDYLTNIEKADEMIHSPLFRPPYGKINNQAKFQLLKKYKLIMWDVLSRDFDKNISSEECFQNVIRFTKPGSIIVFHDNLKAEKHLKYSLPKILEYYTNLGYSFEKIDIANDNLISEPKGFDFTLSNARKKLQKIRISLF